MTVLLTVVLSTISAVGSSLLTIYLTHYHFWKYQRRGELRLKAIDELNQQMGEFITAYMEAESKKDEDFRLDNKFFESFQVTTAKIKALFPAPSFDTFKKLEVMIGPNLGPEPKQQTVDDFIQARDEVLRSLYVEVGILPRKTRF